METFKITDFPNEIQSAIIDDLRLTHYPTFWSYDVVSHWRSNYNVFITHSTVKFDNEQNPLFSYSIEVADYDSALRHLRNANYDMSAFDNNDLSKKDFVESLITSDLHDAIESATSDKNMFKHIKRMEYKFDGNGELIDE